MAGLTPVELKDMIELIRKVRAKGIAIVVVEHVMGGGHGAYPHWVLVLNSGLQVSQRVHPKEVVADREGIRAYLGDRYHAARLAR